MDTHWEETFQSPFGTAPRPVSPLPKTPEKERSPLARCYGGNKRSGQNLNYNSKPVKRAKLRDTEVTEDLDLRNDPENIILDMPPMDFQEDPALKGVYFDPPTKITDNDCVNDLKISDDSSESDSDSDSSSTSSSSSSSANDNDSVCDPDFIQFEPLKIVIPGLAAEQNALEVNNLDSEHNEKAKIKINESMTTEKNDEENSQNRKKQS
ncbi:MAG: hypothetical protein JAY66_22610, partial [Candidatus Thiodiazotropha taylori]|nr:hypothetical protein [Candidatus Thiodiazotropha taylori]